MGVAIQYGVRHEPAATTRLGPWRPRPCHRRNARFHHRARACGGRFLNLAAGALSRVQLGQAVASAASRWVGPRGLRRRDRPALWWRAPMGVGVPWCLWIWRCGASSSYFVAPAPTARAGAIWTERRKNPTPAPFFRQPGWAAVAPPTSNTARRVPVAFGSASG